MPYEQRAKLIDKYTAKYQKSKSNNVNEITIGSVVCLKSLPLYNTGSIGFAVRAGQPKIGQISDHVFLYRDNKNYTFKVRPIESFDNIVNSTGSGGATNEMPPPPSPSVVMDFTCAPAQSGATSNITQPLTGSLSKRYLISFFSPISPLKKPILMAA